MVSTFTGLEIGKRSLIAQQAALSMTGNNIANANTQGYTRQEAVLQTTIPVAISSGSNQMQLGTGVEVSEFRRIREDYLDSQYYNQQQTAGYWQAKQDALSSVENALQEPTDNGLQATLDKFWQSVGDLEKQPSDMATRAVVVSNGQAIASKLSELSAAMSDTQTQLTAKIADQQTNVNDMAKQLGTLNQQITQSVAQGIAPNTLYDQRNMVLDKLSALVPIQVTSAGQGMITVSINGAELVNGTNVAAFQVNTSSGNVTVGNSTVQLSGGTIQGELEANGYVQNGTTVGVIPDIQANLNQLAQSIANEINAIHAGNNARNLDDIANRAANPSAPLEQLLFFVDKNNPNVAPTDAASIEVNPQIVNSLSKVAAAQTDSASNADNIIAIGDLRTKQVNIGGQQTTIDDYYRMIVGKVGTLSQQATQQSDNANTMVQQVDTQRQSVSGVNVDEEMTNMIRYQQAYNAAAKYVSAINDMLDKLINGIN